MNRRPFLTLDAAAKITGRTPVELRHQIADGRLPAYRIARTHYGVRPADLPLIDRHGPAPFADPDVPEHPQLVDDPRPWYVSLARTVELTGYSSRTLRKWIADGRLPAYRFAGTALRLRLDDVEGLATRMRPATQYDPRSRAHGRHLTG